MPVRRNPRNAAGASARSGAASRSTADDSEATLPAPDVSARAVAPMSIEDAATTSLHTVYPSCDPDSSPQQFAAIASRNRTHFTFHMEDYARNEEIAASIRERAKEFHALLARLDLPGIQAVFRERHHWREEIANGRSDFPKICESQNCQAVALTGARYCVAHITRDPDQRLFTECRDCGRVYPKMGHCFFCGGA
jgi:hypothetical protein